jgi:cell fate regulator YaaT (PSP1 superfamily)
VPTPPQAAPAEGIPETKPIVPVAAGQPSPEPAAVADAGATAPEASEAAPSPPQPASPERDAETLDETAGGPEAAPAPAPMVIADTGRPTAIVRFGAMGFLGRFVIGLEPWRCGQQVVIKSDRGQETGAIVCAWNGCGSPGGVPPQIRGEILRHVTHADEVEARHLAESERREFAFGKQCIATRTLPMKLVVVEHLFGGDRIVFYFVSESRVDFRALVRDLAHEFQTRIEMRQIGVRDEARLLGDYERCGRPLCCRAWIKELEPVSMKMAKVQKATLDPTKISGRCGRLMCCLRFEHTTYCDLARGLPRRNSLVVTPEGPGKVVDVDVMSQRIGVLLGNGTRINVPVESLIHPGAPPPPAGDREAPVETDAEAPPASRMAGAVADAPAPDPAAPGRSRAPPRRSPVAESRAAEAPPTQEAERPAEVARPSEPAAAAAPSGQGGQPGQGQRGRRGRRRSRRGGRNRGRPGGGPPEAGRSGGPGPASPGAPPGPSSDPPPETRQDRPPDGAQGG